MRKQQIGQPLITLRQHQVMFRDDVDVRPAKFGDILQVEDIGLVRKGAGDPLPGQVVAGRVGIDQMLEEPAGTGLPADAPPMHRIGGQIHPRVVVEIACLSQGRDKLVDAGHTGLAIGDIGGQFGIIFAGIKTGLVGFNIRPDALGMGQIEPLPVIAPGQFLNEFLSLFRVRDRGERGIADLVEAEDAMPDIGRQAGYSAIEMVATGGIGARVDGGKRCFGCGAATSGNVG